MRPIRRNIPFVVYHFIWRFVENRWFFSNDAEREVYLRLLGRALEQSDWRCFAYALMSSHIHLALIAGAERLSSWSLRVNSPFALWMNQQHGRIGPIFVRGPKDYAILPAKEAALVAYIHRNPVRAGVVGSAAESTWTSHQAYTGAVRAPAWLHVDEALVRCGLSRATFANWLDGEPGESGIVPIGQVAALARHRGGLRVATPSTADVPLVARPFAHVRVDPRRLIELASAAGNVDVALVCSRRRVEDALIARRAVVHAGRSLGLSDTDLAEALGLSQQGVSKIGALELTSTERKLYEQVRERARFGVSSESRG